MSLSLSVLNRKTEKIFMGFITSKIGTQLEWGGLCVESGKGSAQASTLPSMSGLSRQGSGLLDFSVSDELLDFSVLVFSPWVNILQVVISLPFLLDWAHLHQSRHRP